MTGRTAVRGRLWAALAAAVVAAPCLYLALNRGGTVVSSQAWAQAWVFAALAVCWAIRGPVSIPALGVLLLLWPLAQMAPLPHGILERVSPERAAELAGFVVEGVAATPTISLYPYATARALLGLAAAVGLFLLARDFCRQRGSALRWMAAAVVALGLIEALAGLRQHLAIQTGAASGPLLDGGFARGTFGNRNLLAAWLEGCYGAALGIFLARLGSWRRAPAATVAAGLAAGAMAVAIVCTFSRMGIVALAAATLSMGAAQWRRQRGGTVWIAGLGLAVVIGAGIAGFPGLLKRYSLQALAGEKQGRLAMWKDSAAAAARHWRAGAGAGAFPYAFRRSRAYLTAFTVDHPHNDYLETAVEWGVPAGVAVMAGLAGAVLALARRLRAAEEERRWIGLGCLAGAGAILVHAAADFPLRIPAIQGLVAVLMGMAAGAVAPVRLKKAGWAGRTAATVAAAGLAGVSLWARPPQDGTPARLERWNAEAHYRASHRDSSESGYRRALERNPYAAVLWIELALAAEERGEAAAARRSSDLALAIEPHSRRVEWAAANLRLRLGDLEGAAVLLGEVAAHSPEWRAAAWETCWGAGMEAAKILETAVGPRAELLRDYCQYLADRRRWTPLAAACARAYRERALEPERLRAIFERLFAAGEYAPALRLWDETAGGPGFANGGLEKPLRGWGLDWVVWPADGVAVERRSDGAGFQLDIEFARPQNILYSGVLHDFAVTPGREYRLAFEAAAEEIASSSGVEVEVVSPRRRLAATAPFRRSTGWKEQELRFRPLEAERICRLRVVRRTSARFDNRLSGRFSLRRVRLTPGG